MALFVDFFLLHKYVCRIYTQYIVFWANKKHNQHDVCDGAISKTRRGILPPKSTIYCRRSFVMRSRRTTLPLTGIEIGIIAIIAIFPHIQ